MILDDKNAYAYLYKAIVFRNMGKFSESLKNYDAALKIFVGAGKIVSDTSIFEYSDYYSGQNANLSDLHRDIENINSRLNGVSGDITEPQSRDEQNKTGNMEVSGNGQEKYVNADMQKNASEDEESKKILNSLKAKLNDIDNAIKKQDSAAISAIYQKLKTTYEEPKSDMDKSSEIKEEIKKAEQAKLEQAKLEQSKLEAEKQAELEQAKLEAEKKAREEAEKKASS